MKTILSLLTLLLVQPAVAALPIVSGPPGQRYMISGSTLPQTSPLIIKSTSSTAGYTILGVLSHLGETLFRAYNDGSFRFGKDATASTMTAAGILQFPVGGGIAGGTSTADALYVIGRRAAVGGSIVIQTVSADLSSLVTRMTISGGAAQGSSLVTINEPTRITGEVVVGAASTGGIAQIGSGDVLGNGARVNMCGKTSSSCSSGGQTGTGNFQYFAVSNGATSASGEHVWYTDQGGGSVERMRLNGSLGLVVSPYSAGSSTIAPNGDASFAGNLAIGGTSNLVHSTQTAVTDVSVFNNFASFANGCAASTVTFTTFGGIIEVEISGSAASNTAGGAVGVGVLMDGNFLPGYSATTSLTRAMSSAASTDQVNLSVSRKIEGVAAGAHSFCLFWRTPSASPTIGDPIFMTITEFR